MSDDDLKTGRSTPPKDDEWRGIWSALEKADRGWIVTGPIHAVITNWKSLAVMGAIVAYVRGPDIIAAVALAMGAVK